MDVFAFIYKRARGRWSSDFGAAAARQVPRNIVRFQGEGGYTHAQRPWPAQPGEAISNRIAGPAGAGGCLASCGACYHCLVAQQVMCQACTNPVLPLSSSDDADRQREHGLEAFCGKMLHSGRLSCRAAGPAG